MGTACFLVLHALKALHSEYDSYWLCLLLALDTLTLIQALRYWAYLKR